MREQLIQTAEEGAVGIHEKDEKVAATVAIFRNGHELRQKQTVIEKGISTCWLFQVESCLFRGKESPRQNFGRPLRSNNKEVYSLQVPRPASSGFRDPDQRRPLVIGGPTEGPWLTLFEKGIDPH